MKALFQYFELDVNKTSAKRWTLLHYAAENNQSDILEYLLKIPNININIQDVATQILTIRNILYFHRTPLHIALAKNNSKICFILLSQTNIDVMLIDYAYTYSYCFLFPTFGIWFICFIKLLFILLSQ